MLIGLKLNKHTPADKQAEDQSDKYAAHRRERLAAFWASACVIVEL
jgi:hypothetical protein